MKSSLGQSSVLIFGPLHISQDSLGKAYSVLNRRRARIVDESIRDGTDTFIIDALLPVVESFGLVNDLRKQTSGSATCQLSFACWELMESDPFVSQTLNPQLHTLHTAHCTLHTAH
jgi:ribosome assembly protein 1